MLSEGLPVRFTSAPAALVGRGKRLLQHSSPVLPPKPLKEMALHTTDHAQQHSQDVSDAYGGNTRWDLCTILFSAYTHQQAECCSLTSHGRSYSHSRATTKCMEDAMQKDMQVLHGKEATVL